ncbi:MAG: exonuclease domain-containing protein [bacterium]|nr:exonuclease domain-containing protein [bacterium]
MFGKNLVIVDVETTGTQGLRDRVIEIAIIRVENNKVVKKFSTLINPQTYVSPFIEHFTGISKEELKTAPVFNDVKKDVFEMLQDAVFVAHNVRFDYTFIKTELKRVGISFRSKTFCTVQLSRRLYPEHISHSLESIINRYEFSYNNRHRAYDDAHILWQFLKKVQKEIPKENLKKVWLTLSKSLHNQNKNIQKQVDELPESPGVYIFYDKKDKVIFIGKSNNVSERVISYFSSEVTSTKRLAMIKEIYRIGYIQTAGELGARLLDIQMIKKSVPIYNIKSKINIPVDSWPFKGCVEIIEKDELEDRQDIFKFDKWCLISSQYHKEDKLKFKYVFDVYVYKILNRYIAKHCDYKVIPYKKKK